MTAPQNKYKDLFCAETEDNLNALSRGLLDAEKNPQNEEVFRSLMRYAHTIKGSAATMEYQGMATVAHAIEDILNAGINGAISFSPNIVTILLSAIDVLGKAVQVIKKDEQEPSMDAVVDMLKKIASGNMEEIERMVSFSATAVRDEGGKSAPITSAHDSLDHKPSTPSHVRVSIDRLNALMGLFEEMLLVRLKLDTLLDLDTDIIKNIADPQIKQRVRFVYEYRNIFNNIARLLSEIQGVLLTVRLVPLDQIFNQFPRMVRDLALRENKKISLHIEGGDIELDRSVLDGLAGALTHLLRNAVDHGIKEEGTITIRVTRQKSRIHVVVADDGGGIDYSKVRAVAVEHGIVDRVVAETMSNDDVADLLFHAQISTKSVITEVSGRGAGLAAVKAFTQDVGGYVSIISPIQGTTGGTRFLLDLPVSLATVKVLLIESRGYTFAIPFEHIRQTIRLRTIDITSVAQQKTFICNEQLTSLFYLDQMLGEEFSSLFVETEEKRNEVAILLSRDYGAIAIAVDDCAGEQELLVKSLPPFLRGVKGFSGSALLPDGRIVLLLDIHGLMYQVMTEIRSC